MVNLGKTHDKLTVVSDQIGTPTYTYDLARLLVDMIETDKYGYYHATTRAATSAGTILQKKSSVRPLPSDIKNTKMCRFPLLQLRNMVFPKRSVLSTAAWINPNL